MPDESINGRERFLAIAFLEKGIIRKESYGTIEIQAERSRGRKFEGSEFRQTETPKTRQQHLFRIAPVL